VAAGAIGEYRERRVAGRDRETHWRPEIATAIATERRSTNQY